MTAEKKTCDLVLAGGGVKGIGLAGAVVSLIHAGYQPYRIAGTSAGSMVGAIVAAAAKKGDVSGDMVRDLVLKIDYRKFLDPGLIRRLPMVGSSWGLFDGDGIFRGDYAREFIGSELANLGVERFKDLKIDDEHLPPERRYRLMVTATDITRGQLVRLPWDYERVYGLDPDEQLVADAVRASMSIPFFFNSVSLTSESQRKSTLVDGGLLSNYPIDALDRLDGKPPRWPSFGVTLLPNLPEGDDKVIPGLAALRFLGGYSMLEGVISTLLVGRDQSYLHQPWVGARSIEVDSTKVGVVDFGISHEQKMELYANGYEAAGKFLETWDFDDYLKKFRPVPH